MKKEHAVVIGGSIAGLMAARALARHFSSVTVLDRDALPDDGQTRKGVPQAQHVHVLLAGGQQAMERFFPGFGAEMLRDGVAPLGWSEDMRWFQHGSWKTRQPCGLQFFPQPRAALESHLRARARKEPGIDVWGGHGALGLLFNAARDQVLGVRVQNEHGTFDLPADLVLDATGRGSQSLGWLQQAGYPAPPKQTLQIDLTYVSQIFRKPAAAPPWQGLAVHPLPDAPRGAVLLPLDAERWIVTLFGYAGAKPTAEPDAFLRFAATLPVPDLHTALGQAQALSAPLRYLYPQQVWHRFDRVGRFPAGLLLLGDAVCSVDPVFGQGMTLACQQALALDRLLQAQPATIDAQGLRQQYFKACQKIIRLPWLITRSEALRFTHLPGWRSPAIRLLQWYTGHVFALSAQQVGVYRAFLDVMHLLAGPAALCRPAVLGAVLRRAVFGPRQRAAAPAATPPGSQPVRRQAIDVGLAGQPE